MENLSIGTSHMQESNPKYNGYYKFLVNNDFDWLA